MEDEIIYILKNTKTKEITYAGTEKPDDYHDEELEVWVKDFYKDIQIKEDPLQHDLKTIRIIGHNLKEIIKKETKQRPIITTTGQENLNTILETFKTIDTMIEP